MSRRKINIVGIELGDVDERALRKLISYYYKSTRDLELKFYESGFKNDNKLSLYGEHIYSKKYDKHIIKINLTRCSIIASYLEHNVKNKTTKGKILFLKKKETIFRVIHTLLHEFKHAHQFDRDHRAYNNSSGKNKHITNARLGYELCPFEAEAEGWALLHINKAIERYLDAVKEQDKDS